jgi:chorismate mutase
MKSPQLKRLRSQIDRVDATIIRMLAKRRQLSRAIGRLKAKVGAAVRDPARERHILRHYRAESRRHRLDPVFIHRLFRDIIRYSRKVQK